MRVKHEYETPHSIRQQVTRWLELNAYPQPDGGHICASCRRSNMVSVPIEYSPLIASVHDMHPDHAGFGSVKTFYLPYCPVCNPTDAAMSRTCITGDEDWASLMEEEESHGDIAIISENTLKTILVGTTVVLLVAIVWALLS